MVEHVVLFRLKNPGPETHATLAGALGSMRETVPGIVGITFGPNFTNRCRGMNYGLVARFADRQGLEAYLAHPAHQAVVQDVVQPLVDDVLALDYEC